MKFLKIYFCVLTLTLGFGHCSNGSAVDRMVRTLHALTRALHYMQGKVSEINLDAVFTVRQVQEQLHAFLTFDVLEFRTVRHWIEVLRDKAKRIADQGRHYVRENDPEYAAVLGFWMDESLTNVWHSSRITSEQFAETRIRCSNIYDNLNETLSDICFSEIRADDTNNCSISTACMTMNSKQFQRDFVVTHQMLFWRFMEINKCVDEVPEKLQQRFCTNIMRDAKLIAAANYPESHRDLFMEQIGLCGFWGFSDFNKPDWLERILDWQQDSGCFSGHKHYYYCTDNLQPDPPMRVKRREKLLSDNCLAHKTSVALLALVANLRFEAEKAFQEMEKSQNGLNKLLI